MNSTIDLLERLTAELAAEVDCSTVPGLSDEGLISLATSVEAHGRLVDALRVRVAGEMGERSRRELGGDGLAARFGCRNANELLQRATLVSGRTAERRLRLGSETRARRSLAGLELPPKFEMVASALASGRLGVDAACAIVRGLEPALDRAQLGSVEAAELELVAAATGFPIASSDDDPTADVADAPAPCAADEIRLQTSVWRVLLDPDGIEPSEDKAMASRGLRLGPERGGLVKVTGSLLPETAARLKKLLDAHLSPRSSPVFEPDQGDSRSCGESIVRASERSDEDPPHSLELHTELTDPDSRTPDQRRHDVLIGILDAAARSPQTPMIGGAAPTILVTVRRDDLESGQGAGFVEGVDSPISMRSTRQLVCSGGSQSVTLDTTGRVISLGSTQRCFTPSQRKAITARDGGCLIPGCSVPASWCEIHHVIPAAKGGPTHTDNGVLLCWFHHRGIETSGWQIRMVHGVAEVCAPRWIDPQARWFRAGRARTEMLERLNGATPARDRRTTAGRAYRRHGSEAAARV